MSAPRDPPDLAQMALTPAEARARLSSNPGPIEQLFRHHSGRRVNKWVHYLPFYDRVFAPYRGRPIHMLEIGVMHGGSLELWRKYFGPEAVLFGIDIDPACAELADAPTQVRIGSQADVGFLRAVAAEMGGLDIVLDDGSHVAAHQTTSFRTLWPLLRPGGLYVIEDMHTAYLERWQGGVKRPGTAVEMVKQLIDDMNAWYHAEPEHCALRQDLGSIHIADSIAAIEKADNRLSPGHIWAGARSG